MNASSLLVAKEHIFFFFLVAEEHFLFFWMGEHIFSFLAKEHILFFAEEQMLPFRVDCF